MALEDKKSKLFTDDKEQRRVKELKRSADLSQKKSFYKPTFSTVTGISGNPTFLFLSQVSDTTVSAPSIPSVTQEPYFEINAQGESYYESGYFE
jgi:hypothetical protein